MVKGHGQGTYNWKDGRIWVGEWENGELSGYAITYDASGSINQEGIFKNGKFLRSLPKCVGSYSVTTWTNCFGTFIIYQWRLCRCMEKRQKERSGDLYLCQWK